MKCPIIHINNGKGNEILSPQKEMEIFRTLLILYTPLLNRRESMEAEAEAEAWNWKHVEH